MATRKMWLKAGVLVWLGVFGLSSALYGMATEQVGPDREHPTVAQPDWPQGIVSLPRHPSRVYSIWVNGGEEFYFKAGLAQINELLALFAKARLRAHEVWIQPGRKQAQTFQKDAIDYNVNLRVLGGIALAMTARERAGESTEPRLTVYVDDTAAAEQLVVPTNLIVHCQIEGARLKSSPAQPVRNPWYGRVKFDEPGSLASSPSGITIQISLWERGFTDCVKLARVSRDGLFRAAFSDQEMADLKGGRSWLTITAGNWLTEAKGSDLRFPAEGLGTKETAKTVTIPGPKFYYGRVLFEDGSPPKLQPGRWPGARIQVDFSYAGGVEPDEEGYFKVFFTPEQYDKVAADRPRKNIYVPDLEQGRSTARFTFPPSLLSQDKTRAGVVKIPRPNSPER